MALASLARACLLTALFITLAACAGTPRTAPPRSTFRGPPLPPVAASANPVQPSPPELAPAPDTTATGVGNADDAEAPPPPGFVRVSTPFEKTIATRCGSLLVENQRGDPRVFEPWVRVSDAEGRTVYEARGRHYRLGGPGEPELRMSLSADLCGDLTGDGVPELTLVESTIGAHCCHTYYVVSLTSPAKRLLMWEKGDSATTLSPEKLKPGSAYQLVASAMVWPPFNVDAGDPALSYAGVPSYPIVFDLDGGMYVPHTLRFRDVIRRQLDEREASCAHAPEPCEGRELLDWGLALMAGDWGARKKALVPDNWLRGVLDRRAGAMRVLLRRDLGY